MDLLKQASILFLMVVSVSVSALVADETVYLPARFADGGNSLLDELDFDTEEPNFTASAFCQAVADGKGVLKQAQCLITDRAHLGYKSRVESALSGFAILPATVNSRPVDVRMKLTVSYFCKEGKCRGLVSLNDGQSRDEFGINYVSPQLIIDSKDESLFDAPRQYKPGVKYSIEVAVDEAGDVSNFDVLQVTPEYKKWVRSLKRKIPNQKYIPGIYEAAYTKMSYYHVYWVDKQSMLNTAPITGNKMHLIIRNR